MFALAGHPWEQDTTQLLSAFISSDPGVAADTAQCISREWRSTEPPQVIELRSGRRVGRCLAQLVGERTEILRRMDDFLGGGDVQGLVRRELHATLDLVHDASCTEASRQGRERHDVAAAYRSRQAQITLVSSHPACAP